MSRRHWSGERSVRRRTIKGNSVMAAAADRWMGPLCRSASPQFAPSIFVGPPVSHISDFTQTSPSTLRGFYSFHSRLCLELRGRNYLVVEIQLGLPKKIWMQIFAFIWFGDIGHVKTKERLKTSSWHS